MRLALALLVPALAPALARADVKVDWARGLVIAEAVGIADRHAPSPAVARGTSRRGADTAAKKLLAGKLGELPLAAGGKVSERAKEADVQARLAAAVEHAITLAADPETDGAWRVTLAVPIEAVRQALSGPRALGDGDRGPPIVVIEGATAAKPAIGWKVGGQEVATVWVTQPPAWAKDAPHAQAKSAKAGAIEVTGIDVTPATSCVIITKP